MARIFILTRPVKCSERVLRDLVPGLVKIFPEEFCVIWCHKTLVLTFFSFRLAAFANSLGQYNCIGIVVFMQGHSGPAQVQRA